MKKFVLNKISLILLLFIFVFSFVAVSCSDSDTDDSVDVPPTVENESSFEVKDLYYSEKDDKTGKLLSSTGEGESYVLFDEASGDFSVDFRVLTADPSISDFTSVTFTITDLDSDFSLHFIASETSMLVNNVDVNYVANAINLSHPDKVVGRYRSSSNPRWGRSLGEFLNESADLIRFKYDTDKKHLFSFDRKMEYLWLDLKTEQGMAYLNTDAVMPNFERYSVSVKFSGIKNEDNPAKIVIYSINGQSFDNVNQVGPNVYGDVKINNGVIGKKLNFDLSELKTFDVIDGKSDLSNALISIVDPSGIKVVTNENSFVPTEVGDYVLSIIPEDKDGVVGEEKKLSFKVFKDEPDTKLSFAYDLCDMTVGVGGSINLPSVKVSSKLTLSGNAPSLELIIYAPDGTVYETLDASVANSVVFDEVGEYTVTYKTTSTLGTEKTCSAKVNVSSEIYRFNLSTSMEETYILNQNIIIPSAKVEGETVNGVVFYPSGASSSSRAIVLDEIGSYTVKYSYQSQEYLTYFSVVKAPASLFENESGIKVENYVSTPSYAARDDTGVKITATETGATATFTNPVKVSDNKKEDNLFRILFTPQTAYVEDFQALIVTLKDVENPDIFVKLKFTMATMGEGECSVARFMTNKMSSYSHLNSSKTNNAPGFRAAFSGPFVHSVSSVAKVGPYPAVSFKIGYDYSQQVFYVSFDNDATYYKKIIDLRAEGDVGIGNAFDGFPSGYASISFTFEDMVAPSASFMIFEIDGHDLTNQSLTDFNKPDIMVDFGDYQENSLPQGVIDKIYPYFSSTAFDDIDGIIKPSVDVFYKYGDKLKRVLDYSEDYFTPKKEGIYVLSYSAMDSSGNIAIRNVEITVVDSVDDIEINGLCNDYDALAGIEFSIPNITVSGGSGKLEVTKTLYFGDIQSGETVKLHKDKFVPEKSGTYYLQVSVYDYVKNSASVVVAIEVGANSKPVIMEKELPLAVFVNKQYTFEPWDAYIYNGLQPKKINVKITVNDNEIIDGKWTPTATGEYTVKFIAGDQPNLTVVEKKINVVSVEKDTFLMDYFYVKDIEKIAGSRTNIPFKATGSNTQIFFVKSISQYGLDVQFNVDKANNNFDGIRFTVVDSVNKNQRLVFEINKASNVLTYSYISLNGGEQKKIEGSFFDTTSTPFEIRYDYKTGAFYDYVDNLLGYAENSDGTNWTGFDSGFVYLYFEFINPKPNTSILTINNIGTDLIKTNTKADLIAPHIYEAEIQKVFKQGETVQIAPLIVFDLLSDVTEFTLTVKSPSGKIILDKVDAGVAQTFKVEEYGQYEIDFVAKDSAGNTRTVSTFFNCFNYTNLKIEVEELPKTMNVGESFDVPSVNVVGAKEATVSVVIINADGSRSVAVNGKLAFTQTGTNRIMILAYDKDGNAVCETFDVEVVG